MVFDAQVAVMPVGKPTAIPMPVAPVVVWVIGVKVVVEHNIGLDDGENVIPGVTVIVPVAVIVPQPPVKGME